jgi:uncharacterized protein (TIGR03437 family)
MRAGLAWLVLVPCLWAGDSATSAAPSYSAAGVVNAVTYSGSALAPNVPVAIFGENLSWSTRGLAEGDLRGGMLPTELAGVRVFVANLRAHLYYVSAGQVNFLVPSSLRPGDVYVWLVRDGTAGPRVRISLLECAPALFQDASGMVLATHAGGEPVTAGAPARGGEIVVFYAAGLGRTDPEIEYGKVPTLALPLRRLDEFGVRLGGLPLESWRIKYAGVAPGFAGLYQINVELPEKVPADAEVRLAVGEQMSVEGAKLAVR